MAGFFNTSWDLGNMFASPFANNQMVGGNLPTEITPRPGSEGPGMMPTNTWGAPDAYKNSFQSNSGNQSSIFGNPYSAGGNIFYNPYQFGQVQYGTQYGGGQEMPWWMNYNVNNPFMPTQPSTPSVQPQQQPQTPRGPQGTGPDGKDLTYDETIKYFGLYDDAESALAAGDSQAAYRKDHMQWRSGTGNYEGEGPGQGQYPGRPDLGIAGDAQRMTDLMGLPQTLLSMLTGQPLDAEPAIGGGSGFTQVPMTAGPFDYLQRGRNKYTASDVQAALDAGLLDPDRVGVEYTNPIDPMLRPENTTQANLPRGFFPEAPNDKQLAEIQRSLLNQVYTVRDNRGSFIESDIPPYDPYQNNQGSDRFGPAPTTQYDAGPAEMTIAEVNALGASDGQARYERGLAETAAARIAAEKQAAQQEQANIFLQNSLAEQRAREAEAKAAADRAAQDRQDAARRQNNRYETGPVTPNIFTSKKPTVTDYTKSYSRRYGL